MQYLNAKALGLSLGIIWGLTLAVLALVDMYIDYGIDLITLLGELYIGYAPTALGALIGAAWGFVDAFIFGFLIAWVYNRFV